ncbi:MAG: NAD(P)H-hydrate dehydratase [Verrucomicrobiota bacterium]|nr:NAD(P)H-hydrate dehydratase [Verrucomicrobiota bacterium]
MELHPILTCNEARAYEERLLPSAEAVAVAMQRAGRAVGQAVLRDYREIGRVPPALRLLVLAGTGNNAGDALLAAVEIGRCHPEAVVTVIFVFGQNAIKSQCKEAFMALASACAGRLTVVDGPGINCTTLATDWHIVLDGIVGMRFHPPLRAPATEILGWVNELGHKVQLRAAVDIPSGLGEQPVVIHNESVFRADFTYATGIVKAPVVAKENAAAVGRLRYLDLGFFKDEKPDAHQNCYVMPDSLINPLRYLRNPLSDKRTYGHIFLLGGSQFMTGAILMAIQAAVCSGAGLVTGMVPGPLAARLATVVPESMWMPLPVQGDGTLAMDTLMIARQDLDRATALLIGPGMDHDKSTRILIARLAREIVLPMVLDASALLPDVMAAVIGRPKDAGAVICTPHWGEFSRMSRTEGDGAPENTELMEFSRKHRVVTVLKGPLTRVSDGTKVIYIPHGGPVLARGGSGDILAGIIGAQYAQHPKNPLFAACRGALWHAKAADLLAQARGHAAVRTTELLDYLNPVLREQQY